MGCCQKEKGSDEPQKLLGYRQHISGARMPTTKTIGGVDVVRPAPIETFGEWRLVVIDEFPEARSKRDIVFRDTDDDLVLVFL